MTVLDYLDGVNEKLELQDELDRLREKYGELREDYTIAEDRIAELESLTTGLAENAAWMSMELEKYQWISVKDRVPEKDGSYLIAMYHRLMVGGIYKTYTAKFVASFNAEYKEWTVMGEVCTTVTHWMNLPDFPEE